MADLHQPHDRLFRAVFSDADEAASLLQAALPSVIRDSFDWTTLTLLDGTFIDEDLQGSQSHLLYQVEHTKTGQTVSMYLLFEHQSTPDPWMPLKLLRYCCRIWEAGRRDDPAGSDLRPIVPVVFYQRARGWSHSTEFADLFSRRRLPLRADQRAQRGIALYGVSQGGRDGASSAGQQGSDNQALDFTPDGCAEETLKGCQDGATVG